MPPTSTHEFTPQMHQQMRQFRAPAQHFAPSAPRMAPSAPAPRGGGGGVAAAVYPTVGWRRRRRTPRAAVGDPTVRIWPCRPKNRAAPAPARAARFG